MRNNDISNKEIGKKAEQIVIESFKKSEINVKKVKNNEGFDLIAGNRYIEVKGTRQTIDQKSHFTLTKSEFLAACKYENYWVYWVNTKEREIVLKINRNKVLKNIQPYISYRLQLGNLKDHKIKK